MTSSKSLKVFEKLTILDVTSTEKETKIFVMPTKDISFSNLYAIKEQLNDIREIVAYTHESKLSPNGEQCQIKIIVDNNDERRN